MALQMKGFAQSVAPPASRARLLTVSGFSLSQQLYEVCATDCESSVLLVKLAQETVALWGVFGGNLNINLTLNINLCLSKPNVCWSDYIGCTQQTVFVQLVADPLPNPGDEAAVPLWESIVYYPVGAI